MKKVILGILVGLISTFTLATASGQACDNLGDTASGCVQEVNIKDVNGFHNSSIVNGEIPSTGGHWGL